MRLASDYLHAMLYLHASPIGVRVMCDGDYIEKLMSQFLVSADFHMVVHDLDALPEIDRVSKEKTIKCGHRQARNVSFLAPEQIWPFETLPFRDEDMPPYDERVDVWKLPEALKFILTDPGWLNLNYLAPN